jgi:hypothetical protein
MEKNEILPYNALTSGYILIPKKLLYESLKQKDNELSYLEAFLMVLTKVNFKDTVATIYNEKIICHRGESLISMCTWAELFHWKRHKTRRFFARMERNNLIQTIPMENGLNIIRVVNYDLWTSKCKEVNDEKPKTKIDESFDEFWDAYHEVTGTPKREIVPARREWSKLTMRERRIALEQINYYYHSLENTKYIKRAFRYLRDKSFLNE